MVQDWNVEWVHTCESFEKLEQERLEFFKSNLSNFANLMIGCHEGEIQVCVCVCVFDDNNKTNST